MVSWDPEGQSGSCGDGAATEPDAFLAADTGALPPLGGQDVGVLGVLVAPAQITVQLARLDRAVGVVGVGEGELPQRPKCASIGFAQDAFVGVKHNSTLFFAAQRRIRQFLWADRLSRMTELDPL